MTIGQYNGQQYSSRSDFTMTSSTGDCFLLQCLPLKRCLESETGLCLIGHVTNFPTMQSFTGISKYTQSKSDMLSLTECVREFQNDALWDTH